MYFASNCGSVETSVLRHSHVHVAEVFAELPISRTELPADGTNDAAGSSIIASSRNANSLLLPLGLVVDQKVAVGARDLVAVHPARRADTAFLQRTAASVRSIKLQKGDFGGFVVVVDMHMDPQQIQLQWTLAAA